eukprot:TRINITY_DN52235_c0_g1_i1.p1 TRINITY_DN52235_c0_g1~~TRINITY_DN52235_c0_g1_i1.p1  ORF type:complete len:433 (-),score=37.95 TRINITY_DN52235_c0_g1_i1:93-1391(-)
MYARSFASSQKSSVARVGLTARRIVGLVFLLTGQRLCGAASAIVVGGRHACGLLQNGSTVCWGSDRFGQTAAPEHSFAHLALGGDFSCGLLRSSGLPLCWGRNDQGQTEAPNVSFVSIDASVAHACGILSEGGDVLCWGQNTSSESSSRSGPFRSLALGAHHSCGILQSGQADCWGDDTYGQSSPPTARFDVIAASFQHNCGLTAAGEISCWGADYDGKSTAPVGPFLAVAVSRDASCGLRPNKQIRCWGRDDDGQATPPPGTFENLFSGEAFSCGHREEGTLACWPKSLGQLFRTPLDEFAEVALPKSSWNGYFGCGLRYSGEVTCWERSDFVVRTFTTIPSVAFPVRTKASSTSLLPDATLQDPFAFTSTTALRGDDTSISTMYPEPRGEVWRARSSRQSTTSVEVATASLAWRTMTSQAVVCSLLLRWI